MQPGLVTLDVAGRLTRILATMDSTLTFAVLFASAASVAVSAIRRIDRIHAIGGDYALPWYETFDFSFRVSFPDQASPVACAAQVSGVGISSEVEITPNGRRWAVTWRITARAIGSWYRELSHRIVAAASSCGLDDPVIIASASKPGSGTALVLANCTLQKAVET